MKFCPSCGEENPERARFCLACGTELPVETEERFRKVITLLFSDVVGSTTLGERLDPEALSNVMTHYYETMKPIIERHGGTVAKFIGDAIMAVFGIPVLHEDDALRASRAALEMQERLDELNVELERRWGVTLQTRTGLNTGEVSGVGVARAQNFVAGDAANTAARFQQNAMEGQILFGDATYRLVRDGVRVQEMEALTMKGKAEPVRTYLLLEVLSDAEALRRRHGAALVGRETELDLLNGGFRRAILNRSCAMVALLADAGVGKSRLVAEFSRHVEDEALVVHGRCLPYGEGITFWPLLEIVRELGGLGDDDTPAEAVAKLQAVAGPDAAEAVERVASAVGLSDAQFPVQEIFWGTRMLVEQIASERPLVVVFDDLHWAEPTLLDLVEHLLDSVSDTPLLLLCAARHDLAEQRAEWGERDNVTALHLRPLSGAEVERVIANMLGDVEIAGDARARIVSATEGNPLFVEQMLAMMLDEGLLVRVDGRLEATTSVSQIAVPPSIDALLAARVDRLPKEERAVVEPAAVVGLTFPQAAVENLVPDDVRSEVLPRLDMLTRKQLISPDESEPAHDGDAYRFNHILIRDAAYESVLKQKRADLHERVAEWTERVAHEHGREVEFEEILGYHLEQAHRYRAELGPLDDRGRELGLRAAKRLASAGNRAFQRGDVQAAANLLGRAVELLPPSDRTRLELVPDLAEAITQLGDFQRALAILDDTIAQATEVGDQRLRAHAQVVRLFVQGVGEEAAWGERLLPEAEAAMRVLELEEDHSALAKGWRLIASVHGTACRYAELASAAQRAMIHSELAGDRRQQLRNRTFYVEGLINAPAPVAEAIEECERILEESGGDRRTRAYALRLLAPLQAMQGEFDEARASYVSARALFEDLGVTILSASVSVASAEVELLAGDLAAAERELRRDYEVLERLGERFFLSTIAGLLGQVLYGQGRYAEARQLADTAREIADEDDVLSQVLWRCVVGKLRARDGDHDGALALIRGALDLARHTDSPIMQADVLVDLAETLKLSGRPYAEAADEAAQLYERKGNLAAAQRVRSRTRVSARS